MLRRLARTVVANPRRAAAVVAATTASIAAYAATSNTDRSLSPSHRLYTRFHGVEFKAPAPLARTFLLAQSIEPGESIHSAEATTDQQLQDHHEQRAEDVSPASSTPAEPAAHHCEHCVEAPAVPAAVPADESIETPQTQEQEHKHEHVENHHQHPHHDAKEEATPLDAPHAPHAEHHHHPQQAHFDAHELPPLTTGATSTSPPAAEPEKRVAADPVLVTLAGVRAQEFIELERHYRAQLEEAVAHKEREFAERLLVERAKMQEEFQEALEDYEGHIKEQYSELLANKASAIQKQLAKRFEERVLEIEDQYKRGHLRLEQQIHENVLKEANRRGDIVASLKKRLHVLEHSLAKKEQEAAADLRSQQICLAIFALSTSALDKPGPFKKQLARALEVTGGHEVVQEALNAIPQQVAAHGVTPIQELNASFKEMRNIGRRDALIPEGGGLWWELFASAVAAITSPVRGWVEGDDPDAIFARAEYFLERGNIKSSIDELAALKGLASVASRSWIRDAQDRLAVEQAIYTVRNYVANSLVQEH